MSAQAWSDEPDEPTEAFTPTAGNRSVVAVTALAAVALALASIAAVMTLLSPHPEPDQFTLRPAPVEQAPPPAAVAPKPPAQAPPVAPPQAAPPAHEQEPPNAHQTFTGALRGETAQTQGGAGLYPTEPQGTIDSEAEAMCQDLSHGGAIQPYIDGTLAKSPTLAPWQAAQVVHQAIRAYCPQYDR